MAVDDGFHYQTSEKVRVEFESAPVTVRCAAFLIDLMIKAAGMVVMYAVMIVLMLGNTFLEKYLNMESPPPGVMAGIFIFFIVLLLFYNLIFEQVWKGQTPGKRITRIRAVNDDGTYMGFTAVALRNLFRIADMLPFGYIAGLATMAMNKKRKRIGDFVAGTMVIRERGGTVPDFSTTGDTGVFPGELNVSVLVTPGFRSIINSYFETRQSLGPVALERVERDITSLIEERTGVARPGDLPASRFIEELSHRLS